MKNRYNKTIPITVSQETHKRIKTLAVKCSTSMINMVELIVDKFEEYEDMLSDIELFEINASRRDD